MKRRIYSTDENNVNNYAVVVLILFVTDSFINAVLLHSL